MEALVVEVVEHILVEVRMLVEGVGVHMQRPCNQQVEEVEEHNQVVERIGLALVVAVVGVGGRTA